MSSGEEKVWVTVFTKPLVDDYLSLTEEEVKGWEDVKKGYEQWLYQQIPEEENDVWLWKDFIARQRDAWIAMFDRTIYPFAELVRKEKWSDVEAACFSTGRTVSIPTMRYTAADTADTTEENMEMVD